MTVGAVLGGKYRLEALLGQGGMGSVWRARNLKLDAPVAVKLMAPAIVADESALQRFHREAHAGATLRSPHILQVFDHDVDAASGQPYIVMELLDGEPLSRRLERVGLSLAQTEAVLADVCRGLAVAHQHGVVHRDLKPDNIFLERNQDEELAKILDFGIAKSPAFALGPGTQTGAVMGTPFYMSPEQIRGAKHVDARSDLWSLAVIVYECVTGRRPFHADTLGALAVAICTDDTRPVSEWVRVPGAVDAWFARALARDPEHRFQSAGELARAFSSACAETLPALTAAPAPTLVEAPAPHALPSWAPKAASAASRRGTVVEPAVVGATGNRAARIHGAGVKAGASEPTAVEPTAVEPTAVEPTAVEPAAVEPRRGWSEQTRQMVFGYAFSGVVVVGMLGYGTWSQNEAIERAEAISQGRPPAAEAPADYRATARHVLRLWLPSAVLAVGTLGWGLRNLLAKRKAGHSDAP
jgi:eukaryotic-like serine/threonine-protein kinase